MNSQTIEHKPGDTFSYSGFWPDPLASGTWSGACYANDASTGERVQEFTVSLTPPVDPETRHAITIRAESDATAAWPVDSLLKCDVRLFDASTPPVKTTTRTFGIKTVKAQTNV